MASAGNLAQKTRQRMRRQQSKNGRAHCGSFQVQLRGNSYMATVPKTARFVLDVDGDSEVFVMLDEDRRECHVKPAHLHPELADDDSALGPFSIHWNTNSPMSVIPREVSTMLQITDDDSVEVLVDDTEGHWVLQRSEGDDS